MNFAQSNLTGAETVMALAAPLLEIIATTAGLTEISMSKPGHLHLYINGQWHLKIIEHLDRDYCTKLAESIAYRVRQDVGDNSPLLSTTLPTGERIQVVVPPACDPDQIIFSIRVPDVSASRSLESYEESGIFDQRWSWIASKSTRSQTLNSLDQKLVQLLKERDLVNFLRLAVRNKKTIAVIGDTGSGKTTLMKSMCLEIPTHERLITIEDARELIFPKHGNVANLLYAKSGAAASVVTPSELIGACMRLLPERVLLAELRGAEAWDFLKLTTTMNGCITSFHAQSCAVAFNRWAFMCKEHKDAGSTDLAAIKELARSTCDVIVHISAKPTYSNRWEFLKFDRHVTQVYFDPGYKMAIAEGDTP